MKKYVVNRWYGWNGGKCPVSPDTLVQVVYNNDGDFSVQTEHIGVATYAADIVVWEGNHIIAFRILEQT